MRTQEQQGSSARRARSAIALSSVALLLVLSSMASAAAASVLHFKGSANADAQTQVSFDVSGHYKKVKQGKKTKKVFVASKVSNARVEHQTFVCTDVNGNTVMEGRSTFLIHSTASNRWRSPNRGNFRGSTNS